MNNYMDTVKFLVDNPHVYWWSIYFPIAVWMLLVLTFFIMLLKRYTFGNWTPEHPNPFAGETFSMPRGIFRGTLTLTLLFVVIVIELTNVRIIGLEDEIRELMIAFQMMIAFYFGSKVMHHITATERNKTRYIAQSQTEIHAGSSAQPDGDFDAEDAAG